MKTLLKKEDISRIESGINTIFVSLMASTLNNIENKSSKTLYYSFSEKETLNYSFREKDMEENKDIKKEP